METLSSKNFIFSLKLITLSSLTISPNIATISLSSLLLAIILTGAFKSIRLIVSLYLISKSPNSIFFLSKNFLTSGTHSALI